MVNFPIPLTHRDTDTDTDTDTDKSKGKGKDKDKDKGPAGRYGDSSATPQPPSSRKRELIK